MSTCFEIIFLPKIQKLSIKDIKVSIFFNYSIPLGFSIKSCQNFQKYSLFLFFYKKHEYFENFEKIYEK
jgi:hypothetical protein